MTKARFKFLPAAAAALIIISGFYATAKASVHPDVTKAYQKYTALYTEYKNALASNAAQSKIDAIYLKLKAAQDSYKKTEAENKTLTSFDDFSGDAVVSKSDEVNKAFSDYLAKYGEYKKALASGVSGRQLALLAAELRQALSNHAAAMSALTKNSGAAASNLDENGVMKVPVRYQRAKENGKPGSYYCGPTSLGMLLDHYGNNTPTAELATLCKTDTKGTIIWNMVVTARNLGFKSSTYKEKTTLDWLNEQTRAGTPVMVAVDTQGYWPGGHYMVVRGISGDKVYVNDPWGGPRTYSITQFMAQWQPSRWSIIVKK
jgi:predicted double-glycine peptidase